MKYKFSSHLYYFPSPHSFWCSWEFTGKGGIPWNPYITSDLCFLLHFLCPNLLSPKCHLDACSMQHYHNTWFGSGKHNYFVFYCKFNRIYSVDYLCTSFTAFYLKIRNNSYVQYFAVAHWPLHQFFFFSICFCSSFWPFFTCPVLDQRDSWILYHTFYITQWICVWIPEMHIH